MLVLGTLLIACVCSLTSVGAYLDQALAYEPLMKLRAQGGFAPRLDPALRLVIVEDRSLAKLGRLPTFAEWQRIARHLLDIGYERVLLVGTFNLSSEHGDPTTKHPRGFFAAGALQFPFEQSLRAVEPATLPPHVLLPCAPNCEVGPRGIRPLTHFLGPPPHLLDLVDAVGSLNLIDDGRLPLAYRAADGSWLPHLALFAKPGLIVNGGHLANGDGPIPSGFDGTTLVDFVSRKDLLAQSLPVSVFYAPKYDAIISEISPKLREKLDGGRLAILAPEAYTGARFIETYIGSMPAYAATVSLANSVINRSLIVEAVPHHVVLWPLTILLVAFALWRGPKPTLYCVALVCLVLVGTAASLLIAAGIYLRVVDVLAASIFVFGFNAVELVFSLVAEKMKLSRDLELGHATQSIYLPEAMEGVAGAWRYQFQFMPFGPMSGDWIFAYKSPAQSPVQYAVFAMGDVVGKGPAAALNTATIATIWNQQVRFWDHGEKPSIERLARNLNDAIYTTFRGRQNTALTVVVLAGDGAEVAVFGASPWAVARAAGGLEWLRMPPSRALGDLPEVGTVRVATATLAEGDMLFACSDGVIDSLVARTRFKRKMVGVKLAASDEDFSLLARTARDAAAGQVLPDDQTIVMVRRLGAGEQARFAEIEKNKQIKSVEAEVAVAVPDLTDAPPPSATDDRPA